MIRARYRATNTTVQAYSAGDSFTGFLDGDTSAIFAASSVRLLTSFTSDVTTIRRTTGSPSEGDFAFVNGIFDEVGIESFCAATDGFPVEVVDQIGGINLSQSAASRQPQLVSSGVMDKIGGVPFMYFSSDDVLYNTSDVSAFVPTNTSSLDIDFETGANVTTRQTVFVNRAASNNSFGLVIFNGTLRFEVRVAGSYPTNVSGTIPILANSRYKITFVYSSSSVSAAFVNGISETVTPETGGLIGNASPGIQIGGHRTNTLNPFNGKISTLILYNEAKDLAHNQAFNDYESAL